MNRHRRLGAPLAPPAAPAAPNQGFQSASQRNAQVSGLATFFPASSPAAKAISKMRVAAIP